MYKAKKGKRQKKHALAQCKIYYKNEAKPQGNGLHESKTFNATKFHSQVASAGGAQNQPHNTNLFHAVASYMECYNSTDNLQLQTVIKEETPSECDDIGEASTVSFETYQQLLQILNKMSNQIASLQSGMNSMLQRNNISNISTTTTTNSAMNSMLQRNNISNISTTTTTNSALYANGSVMQDQPMASPPEQGRPHLNNVERLVGTATTTANSLDNILHCKPTLMGAFKIRNFPKIKNEAELEAFEHKLEDEQFAKKAEESFKRFVGFNRKKKHCKNVCFKLSRAIFVNKFWMQTNWLGTTERGVEKFAFSEHFVFLEFFKTVVGTAIKSVPAPAYFAAFFQSLAKGRIKNRRLSSRVRVVQVKDETTQNEIKQEQEEDFNTV